MTLAERAPTKERLVRRLAPGGAPDFLTIVTPERRRRVHTLEWVDPFDLNALTQPRDEFTDIPELATSIADIGPLSEIHAAFFDDAIACQEYLDALNTRWKKNHTLADLKPTVLRGKRKGVLIIMAGERRTHAYRLLKTEGCMVCQEERGLGPCFDDHFPEDKGKIQIKVHLNPDYHRQGVPIQEDENFHVGISAGRRALSIYNRYESAKIVDPNVKIADFARKVVHLSPDTVRAALRYVEGVPEIVKRWVNKGKLKYGHGLELARMREVGYDDRAIIRAALPALNTRNKMTLGPFRKRIDGFIQLKAEQQNMMEIFRDMASEQERQTEFSRSVAQDTRLDLLAAAQRLGIHEDLIEHGFISPEDSALASRLGIEALDKLAESLIGVPAHLSGALRKATADRINGVAPKVREVTTPLLLEPAIS